MIDLSKLDDPEVRKAIFLAELAAWLHDWQKCIDMKIAADWAKSKLPISKEKISQWKEINNTYPPKSFADALHSLGEVTISQCTQPLKLGELIKLGKKPSDAKQHPCPLVQLLGKCHDVAHMEKELGDQEYREFSTDWQSTIWGYFNGQPVDILKNLIQKVKPGLENFTERRKDVLAKLREVFGEAWGDTRIPINEVTLWDWSLVVAALYKPELARCVLMKEQREPKQVVWRLLSIRSDSFEYLTRAAGIPDVLARKNLLHEAWNNIQKLLEEEYPLGLEVYRDEDGSLFVVPDIENIGFSLFDNSKQKTLHKLITESFVQGTVNGDPDLRIGGEIIPHIHSDENPWNGKPPNDLPPVGKHVKRKVQLKSDPVAIADFWRTNVTDICTVCGLRPQGPGKKSADRKVCDICEKRRADRSKEWATEKLHTTIWVDEVADKNARLALIVGFFDMEHWLSGDLVRSLTVRKPDDQNGRTADKVAKNPSFARLRRVWETTRRFWQEVAPTDESRNLERTLIGSEVKQKGRRLEVRGELIPNTPGDTLGPYHVYELVLPQGIKIPVVWDFKNKQFITAENLLYTAHCLNEDDVDNHQQAAEAVKSHIKGMLKFEESTGYGAINKVIGEINVHSCDIIQNIYYTPIIPILAEPRTFMALVPADKALEVAKAIKTKYEREMGKVRNRLPLTLGLVFAHRHTPLRAIMDAGRQMQGRKAEVSVWEVIESARKIVSENDTLPKRFEADKNGQFAQWYEIFLKKENRRITWHVPAMMGDGNTEDHWYPYVFLETNAEPTGRNRYFSGPNPWTNKTGWLVHAGDLKPGDRVYFTPSTFDFEWLDANSRRFEIHYDETGRRATRRSKPYYLDDLDRMEELWGYMKYLSITQRHQVVRAIEARREEWFGRDEALDSRKDSVFRQFVKDTLAGAAWPKGQLWKSISDEWQEKLIHAGVCGELTDMAELHMEILKEKEKE